MLDVNMIIANNIQAELKKENKKQVDLAEGIGVSKQTMSKIMNGARAINAIELHKISEYLHGLDKDLVTVDSVLMLMDMFAMPYKAVVLRLFESGNISHQQAEKLLEVGSVDVMKRVSLTGKAKRWQLDGKGTESFGTLLEKVEYNRQHEYLTESREKEDVAYLTQLKKEYGLD